MERNRIFPTSHPYVSNPNGSRSNVITSTVGLGDKTYVLPTMVGGKELDIRDAVKLAQEQGLDKYPSFEDENEAIKYSEYIHDKVDEQGFLIDNSPQPQGNTRGEVMAQEVTNTGRNIADLLGGALRGATAQNEAQAVEGGMKFVQDRMERDERRKEREERRLDRERLRNRQDKADIRAEAQLKSNQATASLNRQRAIGLMSEKAVNTKRQEFRKGLFDQVGIINSNPNVQTGVLSIASEADMDKADHRSGYSQDMGDYAGTMAMALKATEETNPELKKDFIAERDRLGAKVGIEFMEDENGLRFKTPYQGWTKGTMEEGLASQEVFRREKESMYNQSMYDIQSKTDSQAGAHKYAQSNFIDKPNINPKEANEGANMYAEAVANDPVASRTQTATHLINLYTKKKKLTEEQENQSQMMRWEMGLSDPLISEDGTAHLKASELRDYINRNAQGDQMADILGDQDGWVAIDDVLNERLRREGRLTQIYDNVDQKMNLISQAKDKSFQEGLDRQAEQQMASSESGERVQKAKELRAQKEDEAKAEKFDPKASVEALSKVHGVTTDVASDINARFERLKQEKINPPSASKQEEAYQKYGPVDDPDEIDGELTLDQAIEKSPRVKKWHEGWMKANTPKAPSTAQEKAMRQKFWRREIKRFKDGKYQVAEQAPQQANQPQANATAKSIIDGYLGRK